MLSSTAAPEEPLSASPAHSTCDPVPSTAGEARTGSSRADLLRWVLSEAIRLLPMLRTPPTRLEGYVGCSRLSFSCSCSPPFYVPKFQLEVQRTRDYAGQATSTGPLNS